MFYLLKSFLCVLRKEFVTFLVKENNRKFSQIKIKLLVIYENNLMPTKNRRLFQKRCKTMELYYSKLINIPLESSCENENHHQTRRRRWQTFQCSFMGKGLVTPWPIWILVTRPLLIKLEISSMILENSKYWDRLFSTFKPNLDWTSSLLVVKWRFWTIWSTHWMKIH